MQYYLLHKERLLPYKYGKITSRGHNLHLEVTIWLKHKKKRNPTSIWAGDGSTEGQVFVLKNMCPFWDSSLLASSPCLNHPQGHRIHVALDIFLFSSFFLALSGFIHKTNQGNTFPSLFPFSNHSKKSRTVLKNATKSCPKIKLNLDYSRPISPGRVQAMDKPVPSIPPHPGKGQPAGSDSEHHLTNHK